MVNAQFDDETLMRFADGELDEQTVGRIEAAMLIDPELVARIDMFVRTKAQAKAAFMPMLAEPIPAHLAASVQAMVARRSVRSAEPKQDNLLAFKPGTQTPGARRRWHLPIAASIAAAIVGGLVGYWSGSSGQGPQAHGLQVADVADAALQQVLDTRKSGDDVTLASGQKWHGIASFKDANGGFCREFEMTSPDKSALIGVACRAERGWNVNFAVATASSATTYAPASSADALDAYLSAIEAGEPLTAEDEQKLLATSR